MLHSKTLNKNNHKVMTMWFYKLSHGKFHDRRYSDILYGVKSIDIINVVGLLKTTQ